LFRKLTIVGTIREQALIKESDEKSKQQAKDAKAQAKEKKKSGK